jgi:thioredoxin 1
MRSILLYNANQPSFIVFGRTRSRLPRIKINVETVLGGTHFDRLRQALRIIGIARRLARPGKQGETTMAGQNTLHFSQESFENEVLKSSQPVLVDFWAEWCGPCLMLGPVIDELANEYAGKVRVGKVDIDKAPQIAQKFEVISIPTVVLFKNGVAVQRVVGARPKKDYKALLDAALGAA